MTLKLIISIALSILMLVLLGCKSKAQIAAEQGHAMGQYNLGMMYAKGDGVPENKVYAYMWLHLAESQGLGSSASESKSEVATQMTPSQIEEAESLAIECKKKAYKEC